jgi:hypothetical protein
MTDTPSTDKITAGALPYHPSIAVARFRVVQDAKLRLARATDELTRALERLTRGELAVYAAATQPLAEQTDEKIAKIEAQMEARAQAAAAGRVTLPAHLDPPRAAMTFVQGREYIVRHRIDGVQRFDRESRMGFAGRDQAGLLIFSARGPGGTTDAQYGGTQTFEARWIISIEQVERNDAARYVGRRAPERDAGGSRG